MRYCPLCRDMETLYLTRIPYDYDEETDNCEVLEAEDD